jgi:hypothetical protein
MKWLLFFVSVCGLAQTQAEVKGKKVIDDAIQALGGTNFLTMEDRIETGRAYSYYRDQISGLSVATIYTRYLTVAPDKTGVQIAQRERQAFGKDEDTAVLFTEDGGWQISWRGNKEMPADQVERYRQTVFKNIFYILRMRLHEPGMIFEYRGSEVVDNQPVDVVDVTDAQDRVITVDFHQSTRLPIRQKYSRLNPETKEQDEEVTLFSRYQESDGVEWPHQIRRERNGDKTYEIFSESVKINKDLTDDLFSLPVPGTTAKKHKK